MKQDKRFPGFGRDPLGLAFAEFMAAQGAAGNSPKTIIWYRRRLGEYVGWLREQGITDPEDIQPTTVRAFIQALQARGLAPSTVRGYAQIVRTFAKFCYVEGLAMDRIAQRVRMPRVPETPVRAFTPDEFGQVYRACKRQRDRAIVLALLDTGARASEFVALTVGNIDLDTGSVIIERGKGGKSRSVRLGPKSLRAVTRYWRERSELAALFDSSPAWPAVYYPDEPLGYFGLLRLCRILGNRSGVSDVRPHTFRRSCATAMLLAGENVFRVAAYLGHADTSVIERYVSDLAADLGGIRGDRSPAQALLK